MSSPLYYRPAIFAKFPKLAAALSLCSPDYPDGFSMMPISSSEEAAAAHRAAMGRDLGFPPERMVVAKLQHGDTIAEVSDDTSAEWRPEADALITRSQGWLLGVSIADCVGVLLYDPAQNVVAVVHSGWRGSLANIAGSTIKRLRSDYGIEPGNLYGYLSPAPHQDEYETSEEIASQFDAQYSMPSRPGHAWFDNQAVVRDQLLAAGLTAAHMEVDTRSTISELQLHSHRRDGQNGGRMLLAIGIKP